jgi:hypothetical protein
LSRGFARKQCLPPPSTGQTVNTADLLPNGISYPLMLSHVQQVWPNLNIIDDNSMEEGLPFYCSQACCSLTYIRKDGIRYGATSNKHTKADSLAFISDRPGHCVPAEIISLISVKLKEKPPHVCALIQWMQHNEDIPGTGIRYIFESSHVSQSHLHHQFHLQLTNWLMPFPSRLCDSCWFSILCSLFAQPCQYFSSSSPQR